MTNKFQPTKHINFILKDLVSEFEKAAYAGTPGLIGSARENPTRRKLEELLPGIAGIGSGIIVDTDNNVSKQQDIVIYEKYLCPIFNINDTAESTYYPCEGVIAVGEIKSDLGTKELEDAFEKISSVKRLIRYAQLNTNISGESIKLFRKYGEKLQYTGTKDEEFDPKKHTDQIFGFILCNNFTLKSETLLKKVSELLNKHQYENCPNIIISLNTGYIQPIDINNKKLMISLMDSNGIHYSDDNDGGFLKLIRHLNQVIIYGRTVGINAFDQYLSENTTVNSNSKSYDIKNNKFVDI